MDDNKRYKLNLALHDAFFFGQVFRSYTEKFNPSEWEKADKIKERFAALVEDTLQAFEDN